MRFKEAHRHMLSDAKHSKHTYHRHGAEGARKAHNLEDVGSKPTAGIFIKSHQCIKALGQIQKSGSETINRVGIGSSEIREQVS